MNNAATRRRVLAAGFLAVIMLASVSTAVPDPADHRAGSAAPQSGAPAPGTPAVRGRDLPDTPPGPDQALAHPARLPAGQAMAAPKRVRELVAARTATGKIHQLADGRWQAELSTDPVHYRDRAGRWQPIDPTVRPTGRADFPYASDRNGFTTLFGSTSDKLVAYQAAGRSVTLGLPGPARPMTPRVAGATVTYADAFGSADLVYEVTGGALKEKIVLDRPPAAGATAYPFTLALDGVDAVANRDGSVGFHTPGALGPALFYLPKPFMYDSRADAAAPHGTASSTKVTQTLARAGGRMTLTLAADEGWLRSPDRKYPVVVDPTIKIQPTVTQSQDAMITSDDPAANHDGSWRISVGTTTAGAARSLLKFDLSQVPAGTQLDAAQLQTYFDQTHTTDANDVSIEARRVTAAWTENTVTWNAINAALGEVGQNAEQIDNADAGKTAATGEWAAASGADTAQAVAGGYRANRDAATGHAFTWVPRVTESGAYDVQVHYVPGADRATNAPYTVHHAGGQATVAVDQTTGSGSGTWKTIGTWSFNAGTTHKVVLGDVANKVVVADAVRLVKRGTDVKKVNQANVWHNFSVRDTAQSWLDGRQPNHGFMLKASDEAALGRGGPRYEAAEFAYNGETDQTPKLLLTYGRPGVTLRAPTTIRATGADLSWTAYADPSSATGDDLVEYQVHRSIWQNFQPSAATLVAPVKSSQTTYRDTSSTPTPADSTEPFGNAFYYILAAKTKDGTLVPSQTQLVRLPKAGQVVQIFSADARDTTLSSTEATTGHDALAGSPWLSVGNNSTTYGRTRAVVKFPSLAGVPTAARVLDADVSLWGFYTVGSGASYELRGLTRDFDEASASWNRASTSAAWTTAGGDAESTVAGTVGNVTNDPAWRDFDADGLVQRWVNDPATNRGALVKLADEAGAQERTLFLSGEAAEPALRPKLRILYTEPTSANTYYAPTTPDRMIPGDEYVVPVTVTNTTGATWSKNDFVLSYHWELPDGTDYTNAVNRRETALPADVPPGGVVKLDATVMTPILTDLGNKREAFVLKWDMRNKTTGRWLSETTQIPPLAQNITVEDPTSNQLGLEKFYQYTGENAGAGATMLVNQFSGNAAFSYNAFSNPGRGLSTFLRLTYNSQDTSNSYIGYGWSLSTSTVMRLGSPLEFSGLGKWPARITLTDGDGTAHYFELNKHNSSNENDWDYDKPAGVHLYLQRNGGDDPLRRWVMTRPDRSQFYFDDDGYQTATVDKNGNELLFTYERRHIGNRNTGVLKYITDPVGRRTLTLEYFETGDDYDVFVNDVKQSATNLTNGKIVNQLRSIVDVSGRRITFTYSDKGLLQQVVDGAGGPGEKVFGFFYDNSQVGRNAKLIRADDPRRHGTKLAYYGTADGNLLKARVKSVTDRVNKATAFGYADPDGSDGSQIDSTVTDANGHPSKYLIDGFGRATKLTNAKGELTELTWDADNNVRRLQEDNGAVTTWVYDQNTGYPLEIKDPEANKANGPALRMAYRFGLRGHTAELTEKTSPEGRRYAFGYDAFGNLTSVTDPKGTSTAVEGDFTTSYTYDAFGQMLTSTDANEHTTKFADYDAVGYPRKITDALNFTETYEYDVLGNVVSIVDAAGKKSEYTYDVFSRPLSSREPKDAAAGAYIFTPGPEYDENDNVIRETAANGAAIEAGHDEADRMVFLREPRDTATSQQRVSTYEYDAVGNLVKETEPRGTLTSDPNDFVSSYVYDALNRVVQATDANGGKATLEYDNVGNLVEEADQRKNATPNPDDFTSKTAYDLNHRITTVTDAAGFTTKTEYDRDGNEIAQIDEEGRRATLHYDQRGAVEEQRVPHQEANGTTVFRTTRYEYDEVGNQTKVVTPRGVDTANDPDDFASVTVYDELNRVKEEHRPYDRDDTRYRTPDKFLYAYDAVGNLAEVSAPPSEGETARVVTKYTYFDNGWIRSSTEPFNVKTTYDYDAVGMQTQRVVSGTGASRTMNWTYFPDGKKKTQSDDGDGSGAARKNFEYVYDVNANLTQMLDKSTDAKIDTYTITYDKVNRVDRVEEKLGGSLKNTTDFDYDLNDNMLKRTHDRQIAEYRYDVRDLVDEVKNYKSASDTDPKVTTFTYTPRAQLLKETKGNGNTVDYEYYLDQALRHQVEKKPNGTVVNEHTITYDANGNRAEDVARKQNADDKAAHLDNTTRYEYDPRDRIRKVTKTGHGASTESYVHDANDNIIEQTVKGQTTTFNYDRNRLTTSQTAGVTSRYEYDAYGRLTRIEAAGVQIEKYVYDGFDRTVEHTERAGGTTTFKYDPLDRQISRTRSGKTTELVYVGLTEQVAAEIEGGQVRKSYQYGPDGQLLSQVKFNENGEEEDSYHGYNPHTDVEQLTDEQGDSRATYGYTAYGKNDEQQFTGVDKPDPGNPEDPNAEPYNVYRFNAKRFDQATGDYDMGFRDYDPGLNRFLSQDNYNGALADLDLSQDPFTQNRYAFAGGNPITNIELDGHFSLSDIGHAALDVVGLVPGVGEVADLANAAWYAAEGDYGNAALSAASAVPFAGYAASAAKGAKYAAKGADALSTAAKGADAAKAPKAANAAQGAGKTAPSPSKAPSGGGGPAAKASGGGGSAGPAKAGGGATNPGKPGGAPNQSARAMNCATNSFVPGTLVLMADGTRKAIEEIELGDEVLATDPVLGTTQARPVVALITGDGDKNLVEVTVDTDGAAGPATGTIVATDAHPFWVDDEGRWVDAADLERGDVVRTPDGGTVSVLDTRSWTETRRVHNLTVDGVHTYYVTAGDADVLVHNCATRAAGGTAGSGKITLLGRKGDIEDYMKKHGGTKGFSADFLNIKGTQHARYPGGRVNKWAKGSGSWNWTRNKRFMNEAIERGDEIRLVTDPNQPLYKTGNTYQRELKYLKKKGFGWTPSGDHWRLMRVRP
ncbi:DNRLRE domain-containing protein [Actinomycetes bacterium KLBMP 9797]